MHKNELMYSKKLKNRTYKCKFNTIVLACVNMTILPQITIVKQKEG